MAHKVMPVINGTVLLQSIKLLTADTANRNLLAVSAVRSKAISIYIINAAALRGWKKDFLTKLYWSKLAQKQLA